MNSKIIHSCTWVIIQDGDEFAISLLFANDIQNQSATARVNLWGLSKDTGYLFNWNDDHESVRFWGSPFSDNPHLKLWPRIGNPGWKWGSFRRQPHIFHGKHRGFLQIVPGSPWVVRSQLVALLTRDKSPPTPGVKMWRWVKTYELTICGGVYIYTYIYIYINQR